MTLVVPAAPAVTGMIHALVVASDVAEVVRVRESLLELPDMHAHGVSAAAEALHLLEHGMFDLLVVTDDSWASQPALRRLASDHRLDFAVAVLSDGARTTQAQLAGAVSVPRDLLQRPTELRDRVIDIVSSVRGSRRRETMVRWLEREAKTDHLTGLHNRRAFDEQLARDCATTADAGQPISLILADIDGLGRINDFFGHTVGDAVLRRTASSISRSIRGSDFAARVGGDEFAVILPTGDGEVARRVARRVAHEIDRVNAEAIDNLPEITLLFGLATATAVEPDQLRAVAEQQIQTARPVRIPSVGRAMGLPDGPDVA